MTVSLKLHFADAELLLFRGAATDCPPIPRIGDEILHDTRRLKLEGIQYRYIEGHVEIALLA
jgi:hypothetical protein